MKFRNLLLYVILFLFSSSAYGQVCTVADPTGSLLNVRSGPNGRILSKVENGTVVQIENSTTDPKNRMWVHVSRASGSGRILLGWVFKEFLRCQNRDDADNTVSTANPRMRCNLNYSEGDVYYYDSPDARVRTRIDYVGAFVLESTRLGLRRQRWSEISHWTRNGRKHLGWVQERFLENCIPYEKALGEEKWLSFYKRFKSAVDSRDWETLRRVLASQIYCVQWDLCDVASGQVTQDLIFRKLNEKRGQRWALLEETLTSGKFRGSGEYIHIGLLRSTEGSRGFGFELIFTFENGKWLVESFHWNQIRGPG